MNTVAVVGLIFSIIALIVFILNGISYNELRKTAQTTTDVLTAQRLSSGTVVDETLGVGVVGAAIVNTASRANTLMIVNYIMAAVAAILAIYFIYKSFASEPKMEINEESYIPMEPMSKPYSCGQYPVQYCERPEPQCPQPCPTYSPPATVVQKTMYQQPCQPACPRPCDSYTRASRLN